jgi:RNase P protein component
VIRPLIPSLRTGWDILILARKPMLEAAFQEIEAAIRSLLQQADILNKPNEH